MIACIVMFSRYGKCAHRVGVKTTKRSNFSGTVYSAAARSLSRFVCHLSYVSYTPETFTNVAASITAEPLRAQTAV